MTNKELILDSLIDDDEAFTQILEYFELAAEIKISPLELKKLLNEMVDEGYIFINCSWKNFSAVVIDVFSNYVDSSRSRKNANWKIICSINFVKIFQ